MKSRTRIWFPLLALMVFLTISPSAYSDLYWEYTVVTGGVPEGLPKDLPKEVRDQMAEQFKKKTETTKNYLTSNASRIETRDTIMIMDFDSMTMYQLNPKDKTYTKVSRTDMEQMTEAMTEEMQVTPTNETKRISGYKCKKYKATVMGFENEHWLSRDVKGYKEFKAISERIYKKNPKFKKKHIFGILSLYKEGFPVKTVSNVMGMKTVATLKMIEKKSLDKDLFKVPGGFKLKDLKMPPQ